MLLSASCRASYCFNKILLRSGAVSLHCLKNVWTSSGEREYSGTNSHNASRKVFKLTGLGLAVAGCYLYLKDQSLPSVCALEKKDVFKTHAATAEIKPGSYIEGLPVFTSDEVAKHRDESTGIWISYKSGVYDITSFIGKHPGGDKILLGAGGSVEPFWALYAIHQESGVLAMMEDYRIGNLTRGEESLAMTNMDDPFAKEPFRHPALIVRSKKPFNAEPPATLLVEKFITPTEMFYVRNHLPVPEVDPKDYTLEISVANGKDDLSLNVDELKSKYASHVVVAALQCSGNRRNEMNVVKPVKGLAWGQAAMGNAQWKGVRLRDVLLDAGYKDDDQNENLHVRFEGLDMDPTSTTYGASIPMTKAIDPRGDVIIAYEMNGEPLTRDHGYPLRVVVPGVAGARWVKWLSRIEVSEHESESHWQQKDYKSFNPSTDWENVDYSKAPAIQELPITSVVCDPQDGDIVRLRNGKLQLRGYAWSGGGRGIIRVDITTDLGKTWHVAELVDPAKLSRQWAWTRWQANIPAEASNGEVEVWVRAVDSGYNTQPEGMEHIWNFRGVIAHGYHKIKLSTK